ncbi:MAG: preprotein translocase subunit YajC [Holosporaceae bacterium]|jgi:preprotein translocase subunit YajC|nr:preprotein translocase subunit YajC [Holosporaceae bacterium]
MANNQTTTSAQTAVAPATSAPTETPGGGLLGALTPITLMVLVFYFLIIRPQQKREAKNRELINSLKRGDKVVTIAGIIGVVHKIIGEKELSLEVIDGTRLRMLKSSVTQVLERNSELGSADAEEETVPVAAKNKPSATFGMRKSIRKAKNAK